jgi:hypothetical protein
MARPSSNLDADHSDAHVTKLDNVAASQFDRAMKLFGKSNNVPDVSRSSPATALVTASSMVTNNDIRTGVHRSVEERENVLNQFGMGTIRHDLVLQVTVPGRAPFEVRQRVAVPAKATGRQGYELPVGVELPVSVKGDGTLEIDWKAFIDGPDRKAAVQNAAAQASYADATKYTNAVPGMKEKTWASAATGMPMWMEAVRQGKMKRKAFDQQVDGLTRIGQMDPDLAAEGKQTLDAEGF